MQIKQQLFTPQRPKKKKKKKKESLQWKKKLHIAYFCLPHTKSQIVLPYPQPIFAFFPTPNLSSSFFLFFFLTHSPYFLSFPLQISKFVPLSHNPKTTNTNSLNTYKYKPIDTQPKTTSMPLRWQPVTRIHETHYRDRDGDRAEGRLKLQLELQTRTVRLMGYVNGRWVRREENG